MRSWLLSLLLAVSLCSFAGSVDTLSIYSDVMKQSFRCVVISPNNYKKEKAFPVVYLLHGHGGSYKNWIGKVPELSRHADTYQTIIVCPDGAYAGWYFDSPIDSSKRFETYIAKEVPAYIDAHYKTIKERSGRAITGLSMGGHGGMYLGFRHADFFGACGSMSGALLIEYITTRQYGASRLLGDTTNKALYRSYSIMGELEKPIKDSLAIIMDCGVEDFIVEMSRAVHQKMLELKIPHDYTERPGKHDWKYWDTAVEYQLLFFRNYFDRMKPNETAKP